VFLAMIFGALAHCSYESVHLLAPDRLPHIASPCVLMTDQAKGLAARLVMSMSHLGDYVLLHKHVCNRHWREPSCT